MDKQLAAQLIGLAIRALIAKLGIDAAEKVLNETRKAMVAEQRGPTDEELDALFDDIEARSQRIQDA